MQFLNLSAAKPLYKCWKRAVNESVITLLKDGTFADNPSVYQYIEKTYGCKTLHVQRRSPVDKTVRYVDLEFASEKHITLFMLKWA